MAGQVQPNNSREPKPLRGKTLTASQAKAFYDRFGAKQDSQAFYEDAALAELIKHSAFETAHHVFEFGCGTGRFAERLLKTVLPASATYDGVDVSTTMVALACERLAPFGSRAQVRQTDGLDALSGIAAPVDRVVSTYVLDLLPGEEIAAFFGSAARALNAGGKLCLATLTFGEGPLSRAVSAGWKILFNVSPTLVGGCRPIRVRQYLPREVWQVSHHAVISSFGIASEVIVAERIAGDSLSATATI